MTLGYVAVAVDPCIVGKGLHKAQTTMELARPRVASLRLKDSACIVRDGSAACQYDQ